MKIKKINNRNNFFKVRMTTKIKLKYYNKNYKRVQTNMKNKKVKMVF